MNEKQINALKRECITFTTFWEGIKDVPFESIAFIFDVELYKNYLILRGISGYIDKDGPFTNASDYKICVARENSRTIEVIRKYVPQSKDITLKEIIVEDDSARVSPWRPVSFRILEQKVRQANIDIEKVAMIINCGETGLKATAESYAIDAHIYKVFSQYNQECTIKNYKKGWVYYRKVEYLKQLQKKIYPKYILGNTSQNVTFVSNADFKIAIEELGQDHFLMNLAN